MEAAVKTAALGIIALVLAWVLLPGQVDPGACQVTARACASATVRLRQRPPYEWPPVGLP
jgi:hypothetical protein